MLETLSIPSGLAINELTLGGVRMTDSNPTRERGSGGKTSLYLYYDRNDLLLYVGITRRGIARNIEHDTSKEWWEFVARQEIQHHPTRRSALAAERQMIQKHRPPFNVQHNPDHAATREAYLELAATPKGEVRELLPLLHHGKRKTRLPIEVHPFGEDRLMLEIDAAGWPHLNPESVRDAPFEMMGADRRGGVKLIHHAWDGRILRLHVRCRTNARDCRTGQLLLRMPSKGDKHVTVKRVTLVAGSGGGNG